MPHDAPPPRRDPGAPRRDADARRRDHDQIDRLADVLLPDLVGRLAASDLGEIEVREDDWRVRLRRPSNGIAPAADGGDPAGRPAASARVDGAQGATVHPGSPGATVQAGTAAVPGAGPRAHRQRVAATSPAVGVFQPRAEATPGARVRAGDRLAVVDLLGLPQDVVAPVDGIVVGVLVEAGEGVEYGQDLVLVEPAVRGRASETGETRPHGSDRSGAGEATHGTDETGRARDMPDAAPRRDAEADPAVES